MKKILSVLLSLAMLAALTAVPVSAAGSVTPIDGIMWEYDAITGVISFTGTGAVPDYEVTDESDPRPWAKFADVVTAVEVGDGITAIGDNIFKGFSAVTSVTLPEGITDIGDSAFAHCSMTEITFPSTLKTVGDRAFEDTRLNAAVLPIGVTSVGDGAFANSDLAEVTLPETVTSIGDGAFFATALRLVMIPAGITSIGYSTFGLCSSLEFVTLPGGLTAIGEGAFDGCSSLSAISIPDSVTSIGRFAFRGCAFTEVRLPASLTEPGAYAFADSDVKRIILPDSAVGLTGRSFAGMSELQELYISDTNTNYVLEDGVLFNCDKSVLIAYLAKDGAKSYTVPETVTELADGAFDGSPLSSVILPDGLVKIGEGAFVGSGVTSLRIPAGVESVGAEAFVLCSQLNTLLFAGKDTLVDEDIFASFKTQAPCRIYGWEGSSVHAAMEKSYDLDLFVAVDNELGYLDVNTDMWSYEGIEYAVNNGLFRGMSTMYFMPEVKMNRAMLVTVLHRLEGEPGVSEDYVLPFTDADEKAYYYEALLWAAENGIINGVSPTTFAPNDFITREQMVTVLYRYTGAAVAEDATLEGFVDADKVSEYAADAMKWAVAEGIIAGMGSADALAINPKGDATRAQVATIFRRFCTDETPDETPDGENPDGDTPPAEDENPEGENPPAEDEDPDGETPPAEDETPEGEGSKGDE